LVVPIGAELFLTMGGVPTTVACLGVTGIGTRSAMLAVRGAERDLTTEEVLGWTGGCQLTVPKFGGPVDANCCRP